MTSGLADNLPTKTVLAALASAIVVCGSLETLVMRGMRGRGVVINNGSQLDRRV